MALELVGLSKSKLVFPNYMYIDPHCTLHAVFVVIMF